MRHPTPWTPRASLVTTHTAAQLHGGVTGSGCCSFRWDGPGGLLGEGDRVEASSP